MSMGEGIGMDPEIAALFLNAKGNNKNVSGLLNNLDSSMLALIAGVYDPVAAQSGGGAGQLWSSYAGNPDYPVVQDILQKIQGGADPYYLNSYIDSLVANKVDLNGFQDADLKGLAKGLYNEYTGQGSGGGKGGKGSKGGLPDWLRNPTDVYTVNDMPMTGKLQDMISELHQNDASSKAQSFRAGQDSIVAKRKLGPLYGKDFYDIEKVKNSKYFTEEMPGYIKERLGSPEDIARAVETRQLVKWLKETPEGKKIAKENKIDWNNVDTNTGEVYGWGTSKKAGTWWNPINIIPNAFAEVSQGLERVTKENIGRGKITNIRDVVGYKATPDSELEADYLQKNKKYKDIKADQARTDILDQAYREGALSYLQGQGRTPTKDQLTGMLKFIQNT